MPNPRQYTRNSQAAAPPLIPLDRAFKVDEAINTKEKHLVIIRFGNQRLKACRDIDEWLEKEAKDMRKDKNDAVIYTVEITAVPELVARYKLTAAKPTIIFFLDNTVADLLAGDDVTQFKFQGTVTKLRENNDRIFARSVQRIRSRSPCPSPSPSPYKTNIPVNQRKTNIPVNPRGNFINEFLGVVLHTTAAVANKTRKMTPKKTRRWLGFG